MVRRRPGLLGEWEGMVGDRRCPDGSKRTFRCGVAEHSSPIDCRFRIGWAWSVEYRPGAFVACVPANTRSDRARVVFSLFDRLPWPFVPDTTGSEGRAMVSPYSLASR